MFRIAFSQVGFDAAIAECLSVLFGVVRPIRIHLFRTLFRPAGLPATGSIPSINGISWVTSCRLAAVRMNLSGTPFASVTT